MQYCFTKATRLPERPAPATLSVIVKQKAYVLTMLKSDLPASPTAVPPPKLQSSSTNMSTTTNTPNVKTRFLVISDTHASDPARTIFNNGAPFRPPLPKADVLLHCGDLTMMGHLNEYETTMTMLESIDAEVKLVIAGNHDISLDEEYYARMGKKMQGRRWDADLPRKAREMWLGERAQRAGVTYLDEGNHKLTLKNGGLLRVYASPYQPEFCVSTHKPV